MNILSHAVREGQPAFTGGMKMQKTVSIGGNKRRVLFETKAPDGNTVPVLEVPMMLDIKWERLSLLDRMRRPAVYALHEDVFSVAASIFDRLEECDPYFSAWCDAYSADFASFRSWLACYSPSAFSSIYSQFEDYIAEEDARIMKEEDLQ